MIEELAITCRCQHTAPIEAFELNRRGAYRCPECGYAWRIGKVREAYVTATGFLMPPQLGYVAFDTEEKRDE